MSLKEDFRTYFCQTSSEPMGLEIQRAHGCHVIDRSGKSYLDFISGIGVAGIGHSNPAVLKAIADQVARHLHVMVYGEFIQEAQVRLARRLAEIVPSPLSVTYFTNSGTEAVEGALKTAKKFTGRRSLVGFTGGFHGDSHGSLSVTGRKVYQDSFRPLLPGVTFLPFGSIKHLKAINHRTAAVIVEPIQSEGGVRIPEDDFLPALRKHCNETGTLLILDEVMTGMGRTGRLFACQHWGIVPDILVLAKALGGGMPLGAFIGRPDVMKTLSEDPPLSHVTTFGGHPVSCAAGTAALEFLFANRLPEQAGRSGTYMMSRLKKLAETGGVKEVRGKGLLIGLELTSPDLTMRFAGHCREGGLILGWTLHSDTVIRLAPPLIITQDEMDQGLEIMEKALLTSLRQKRVRASRSSIHR